MYEIRNYIYFLITCKEKANTIMFLYAYNREINMTLYLPLTQNKLKTDS